MLCDDILRKLNSHTIVSDLGGVIISVSFDKMIESFSNIFEIEKDILLYKLRNTSLLKKFELGQISTKNFRKEFMLLCGKTISVEEFDFCFNSMILNFSEFFVNFLLNTPNKKYLLSNTNPIHMQYIEDQFKKKYLRDFSSLFDLVFYSYKLNMRKPDFKIYRKLISITGTKPMSSLFIDDLEININAASSLKFNTLLWNQELNKEIVSN